MSEQTMALLFTAACVALLVGWIPCIDRLMRYQPRGETRRIFQRSPQDRFVVTDEEVRQLLRRRPFLPQADRKADGGTSPHPATFQSKEKDEGPGSAARKP